jgi:tRNA pseudouridine13 synthase
MVRASWAELRGPEVRGGGWVTFSLPRGSYATVVLRELMRQDPLTFT